MLLFDLEIIRVDNPAQGYVTDKSCCQSGKSAETFTIVDIECDAIFLGGQVYNKCRHA